MLRWALAFLVIALLCALRGFTLILGDPLPEAAVACYVFLGLAVGTVIVSFVVDVRAANAYDKRYTDTHE